MNSMERSEGAHPCRRPALLLLILAPVIGWVGCGRDSNPSAPAPPSQRSSPEASPLAPVKNALPQAAAPEPVPVPITNMVLVRAGTFQRLKYPVTITRDFWIGKYEVTQGEFEQVLGRNPSHFTGDPLRPVEKVTFLEASNYCAAVTLREQKAGRLPPGFVYRLPSEAEWEYACRAGDTNQYSFGNDPAAADAFAWTAENSDATTHPIGSKKPNPWGIHDMHGNVWEWCHDWYEPYPTGPLWDPMGPATSKFKVFKGGGWNQEIDFARSANRFMMAPSNGIHFVGFRIALGHQPRASTP
ncbi:MAG: formylglycine-generating enzyme family protein [Limisphaerales bacterium]